MKVWYTCLCEICLSTNTTEGRLRLLRGIRGPLQLFPALVLGALIIDMAAVSCQPEHPAVWVSVHSLPSPSALAAPHLSPGPMGPYSCGMCKGQCARSPQYPICICQTCVHRWGPASRELSFPIALQVPLICPHINRRL